MEENLVKLVIFGLVSGFHGNRTQKYKLINVLME